MGYDDSMSQIDLTRSVGDMWSPWICRQAVTAMKTHCVILERYCWIVDIPMDVVAIRCRAIAEAPSSCFTKFELATAFQNRQWNLRIDCVRKREQLFR